MDRLPKRMDEMSEDEERYVPEIARFIDEQIEARWDGCEEDYDEEDFDDLSQCPVCKDPHRICITCHTCDVKMCCTCYANHPCFLNLRASFVGLQVINPCTAATKMRSICSANCDPEKAQGEAKEYLVTLLRSCGYTEAVEIFESHAKE
jgi:hypothetical protein